MRKIITITMLTLVIGCGGSGSSPGDAPTASESSDANSSLKLLASNVFFGTAEAAPSDVDVDTKVLASNVVVSKGALGLDSDNAQNAFEQLAPAMPDFLVGSWTVHAFTKGSHTVDEWPGFTQAEGGALSFNNDGTFQSTLDETNSAVNSQVINAIRHLQCSSAEVTCEFHVTGGKVLSLRVQSPHGCTSNSSGGGVPSGGVAKATCPEGSQDSGEINVLTHVVLMHVTDQNTAIIHDVFGSPHALMLLTRQL